MKIRTASRLLTLLLSSMSVLSLGMFLWSDAYRERCQQSLSRHLNDTLAAIQFRQGSDALTVAVRAYAATGDERYRRDFDTELRQVRQREHAILQLTGENDNAREVALIKEAKRASDELLELEQRIFAAGRAHRFDDALALAYGVEYWKKKSAVLAPINNVRMLITERRTAEAARLIEHANWVRQVAIAVTVINVAVVLAVLLGYFMRSVVVPLASLSQRLRRINARERGMHVDAAHAAPELRELGGLLDKHARMLDELERQGQVLRRAHRQQRAIFNAASSGIAFVREHAIVDCNELLAQLLDYPHAELIGMPTIGLFQVPPTADELSRLAIAIQQKEVYRSEMQLRRRDGQPFWARISGNLLDNDDLAQGSVWVIDDIGAERAAAERMAEARRLADEAAEMKANFLANMSHEIRTPMNVILGMGHLLGKTALDGRQLDYLHRIDIASKHLLTMLNGVLDFSKIEAGQMHVEAIQFDLRRLCEDVCAMLRPAGEAKRLALTLRIAPGLPRILVGDPMRLSQVMINYINNAIKFTASGQVEVVVEGKAAADGTLVLQVEVRDSGIGLTPEQCAKLFHSFSQAEGTTTRRFGGTGLGLAISKGLAALMGGEVGVSSTAGAGSVFWFTATVTIPNVAAPQPDAVLAFSPERPSIERPAAPSPGQAGAGASQLLQQIGEALERNEFGLRELFTQNEPALRTCLGQHYDPLRQSIDRFDFEQARSVWQVVQVAA